MATFITVAKISNGRMFSNQRGNACPHRMGINSRLSSQRPDAGLNSATAMPSFDIVSEINLHEVTNAVDQASREVDQRFDFKGTNAKFELKEAVITTSAQADFQLKQMLEILKLKLAKRGIDVACMKVDEPVTTGQTARQVITLRQGVDTELGKKIQRLVKDSKLKVQAAIQDKQVRVTGKSRDDLQSVIALVKKGGFDLPLQFTNFRD
jgi:uncharacterized protein YajQ (UPF0234 family)